MKVSSPLLFTTLLTAQMTTPLFAQAAQSGKNPSVVEMMIMPLGLLLIMYFFVIRPQQRRVKEQNELLANLKVGEEVYTSSGIIGRIKSVADGFVLLEVSANTSMKVLKSHISGLTKSLEKAPAAKEVKQGS